MPDPRLQQAIDFHLAGRLPEAETLYRAILADQPDEPEATHNLGDIAFRTGQVQQAVALLQKALMADPQNPRNWNSLINVLIEAGYPDDALKVREEGVSLGIIEAQEQAAGRGKKRRKSTNTDADRLTEIARRQILEAESLFQRGKVNQGIKLAGKIAGKYPNNGHAAHVYGKMLAVAGRSEQAIPALERAHAATPDNPEILSHLAGCLQTCGRLRDSAAAFARALEIDEEHADIHATYSSVLNRLYDYQRACRHASRALELEPEHAEALNNLGNAWKGLKQMDKARQCYARALKLKPDFFAAHTNLGNLYRDQEQFDQAEALYKSALDLRPRHSDTWHNLGTIYKDTGRPELAVTAYRKAAELAPDRLEHVDALSEFIRFDNPGDPLILRLEQALESDQITTQDKQFAGFVLGKAMLDLGQHEQAWQYFQLANEAAYPSAEPSPAYSGLLAGYQKLFSEDFRQRTSGFGRDDAPMVLVVGFSRSGKSLVESLLAGHPGLYAQGERRHLLDFAQSKLGQAENQLALDYLNNLTQEQSRLDADEYRERVGARDGQRPINTLPGNVYALGVLGLLLPKVPIIFCRRNLMDLGLACYFKRYATGNRHTYKLEELGRHIRIYEAFIDLWLEVLPNPMLEVQYEHLVADPDTGARQLYEFVGLDYRPEYLEILEAHRELAENIGPAHSLEAPSPIRKDFIDSARPFLNQLQPLRLGYEAAAQALQQPVTHAEPHAPSPGNP